MHEHALDTRDGSFAHCDVKGVAMGAEADAGARV
jgi:hypothetical protein